MSEKVDARRWRAICRLATRGEVTLFAWRGDDDGNAGDGGTVRVEFHEHEHDDLAIQGETTRLFDGATLDVAADKVSRALLDHDHRGGRINAK